MLTRLVLINACTYDLAELDFSSGDSMQLVGGNNVGKSSLIYALNFLFLVNRKLMSFSGGRQADKTTMGYYFKEPERSFIVFEVEKRGKRYCMLVYRDGNNDSRYAKIGHAYQRDLFFKTEEDGRLSVMTWTQIRKQLVVRDIKIRTFQQQQDVLTQVYRTGRNNDAVVWLTKDSKVVGASNSFSKVYRYLINAKLITTDTLRDILLIADNRDRLRLSYQQSSMQHVEQLRRESDRLQRLREIKKDFEQFQVLFLQLQQQEEELSYQAATFRYLSTYQRSILKEQAYAKQEELVRQQKAHQAGEQALERLQKEQGAVEFQYQESEKQIALREAERQQLLALPAENILRQAIQNLHEKVEQLQYRLRAYNSPGQQSVPQLENRIQRLETRIRQKETQLNNIDNWLIFHLVDKDKDRRLLSAILGEEVSRLPKEALLRKVKNVDLEVQLFDGAFTLPPSLELPPLPSPEALKEELEELQSDLKRQQELLETARNQATFQQELTSTQQKLRQHEDDLRRVARLPELEQDIKAAKKAFQELKRELETINDQLAEKKEDQRRRRHGLQLIQENIKQWQQEEQQLLQYHQKLDAMALPPGNINPDELSPQSTAFIINLFKKIEREERNWHDQMVQKKLLFDKLKNKSLIDLADEQAFIDQLTNEYAAFEDKSSGINTILNNIAVQFANPAARFLESYQEFVQFIERSFNRSLKDVSISNIESLKVELTKNMVLQQELEQISQLQLQLGGLFQQHNSNEGLEVLRRYLEQGREIRFADLFSLRLRLKVNGEEKTVDLAKQVESDGTDRMLRLVIVMQVISRLSELSEENKVVLFIDEIATIDGKNRPQLVEFCRKHHFFPIFAAPNIVSGFDRYVLINRTADGRLIVDQNKHYIDAQDG